MKKLLFISLFAALLAAGCSKDEGPGGQGPKIPGDEIWYTSSDGNIVKPLYTDRFGEGVEILSNTYEDGKGVIKFNAPVTEIGYWAFWYCDGLTSITIPDSVTAIGGDPFAGCSNLTAFYGKFASDDNRCLIVDGVLKSFAIGCGATEYTIPDSVTAIEDNPFSSCSNLTAFYGKFASADNRCLIVDGALISFAPAGLTEYTIPDGVTKIEKMVFARCHGLTSVTIPDSVTEIGYEAFWYCDGLTSVTIPDSVTTIEENPFEYCYGLTAFYGKFASDDNRCLIVDGVLISFAPAGLTEYTIPDGVSEIGEDAFHGGYDLTSITIPDSVTEIGYGAFEYCSSLTNVYCQATTPPAMSLFVFFSIDKNAKIYVPRASVEAYKAAQYWSYYADLIQPYDF